MLSTVRIKRSVTAGHVPSSLLTGEIAINEADGLLFWRKSDGTVKTFNLGLAPTIRKITATGVNFNAIGDTALAIESITRYALHGLIISHASRSLTQAKCAFYTAAGAGGTQLSSLGAQSINISTAAEHTTDNAQGVPLNNSFVFSPSNPGGFSTSLDYTTLYFRVTTAEGQAATADVTLLILPLP